MLYYDLSHPPATYIDRPLQRAPFSAPPFMRAALTSAAVQNPPPNPTGLAGFDTGKPLPSPNYAWRLPDGSYNRYVRVSFRTTS